MGLCGEIVLSWACVGDSVVEDSVKVAYVGDSVNVGLCGGQC